MAVKEVTMYKADDGTLYESREDAQTHNYVMGKINDYADAFITDYNSHKNAEEFARGMVNPEFARNLIIEWEKYCVRHQPKKAEREN